MIPAMRCEWCGRVVYDYFCIEHIEPVKPHWNLMPTEEVFICRKCAGENRWRVPNVVTGEVIAGR